VTRVIRMRKAAGIIVIISGISGLIGAVLVLSNSGAYISGLFAILFRIACGAILVAGGLFCLRRKYWGACLASALLALGIGISSTIDMLRYMQHNRGGPPWEGGISLTWGIWILLLGAVISTIFISLRRKEWEEIPDSVNREVSQGG
jgi:hypothetical protein